ncbi:autotransporter-associated beta strand repeat-containing protein [Microvirga roseola]|uniref:autotransporter-associated beta strand repeat-containing protein n=1 Tax=Microvirga roseola TaxID=2883126 RepID=UPI002AC37047|nr:autotransporter-associated beta strand repeat-containing protein [Microvirga roseola]
MNSSPHARLSALLRLALLASTALVGVPAAHAQWVIEGDLSVRYPSDSSSSSGYNVPVTITGRLLVGTGSRPYYSVRFLNHPNLVISAGGASIAHDPSSSDINAYVRILGTWLNTGPLVVGETGNGILAISGQGIVRQDDGLGTVTIANQPGSTGTLAVGIGNSSYVSDEQEPMAPGTLDAVAVVFGQGAGRILFSHTSGSYTFAPTISGFGTVVVRNGTTTLTGDNSGLSGSVELRGGKLSLAASGNIGAASVSGMGGTLAYSAGVNLANSVTLASGSTTFEVAAGSATQGGAISGSGNLIKDGAGTLQLTGSTTYSGTTTIRGGTLVTTGGLGSGPVANSGTLTFRDANGFYTQNISGTGMVHKEGSGTITLRSNNTYTGGTFIGAGEESRHFPADSAQDRWSTTAH